MAASASCVSRSAATTAWAGCPVNRVRYRALRRARRVSSSPAGERRLDDNVVDLAGVAVVGPEYDVGVLEALQVLRRDAGGVVVGCEVVEVVVVQLFLQLAVDDAGNAANGALGRVAGVGASYGGQVCCDLANFLLEPDTNSLTNAEVCCNAP